MNFSEMQAKMSEIFADESFHGHGTTEAKTWQKKLDDCRRSLRLLSHHRRRRFHTPETILFNRSANRTAAWRSFQFVPAINSSQDLFIRRVPEILLEWDDSRAASTFGFDKNNFRRVLTASAQITLRHWEDFHYRSQLASNICVHFKKTKKVIHQVSCGWV